LPQKGWVIRDHIPTTSQKIINVIWYLTVFVIILGTMRFLVWYVNTNLSVDEVMKVFYLGCITGLRVMVLIILSSLIWVPIGVWIGLRPKWVQRVQPIIQILAAFPANLLYPIMFVLIVDYKLNPDVWTSPLIILGTQWYILFNVIVGTMNLPKSLKQVTDNFQVRGWLWWKRLMLPGIFPYFVTGAITAAGGAWNASIVAEALTWKGHDIYATGLGAYIARSYNLGDYPRITLGIVMMCLFVVVINRVFWRPLYNLAEQRFVLD